MDRALTMKRAIFRVILSVAIYFAGYILSDSPVVGLAMECAFWTGIFIELLSEIMDE